MAWSLGALTVRLARHFRRKSTDSITSHCGFHYIPVNRPHAGGVIDGVEVRDDGTLAVVGWAPDEHVYAMPLTLVAKGTTMLPTHAFRVPRPDLAKLAGHRPEPFGLVVEYILPIEWSGLTAALTLNGERLAEIALPAFESPAYCELYANPGVRHRDQIYGFGPPALDVSTEVLDVCKDLPGPLLDFGCGAGALVCRLRTAGIEAYGLELEHPAMQEAAMDAGRPFISFYDGVLPTRFPDNAFASVTCCEVLEHISEYEAALDELARLARDSVLITVPDMSSIPRGFRHGVVPWHLLERSHVNFFTQASLADLLRPRFHDIRFFRIGEIRCSRLRFYTSLVALCSRGDT